MFKIGDYVFDKNNNDRVQIVDVSTVWDFVSYKVFNPVTGAVYKLSADAVEAESCQVNANEYYLRYVAMLSKIKSETSEGILSKLSSGVIPLPHQLHVLNRAVSDNNVRYILADEVGLGKTIEAGLIIEELKARGLIKRILVVCPTGLVTQWSIEMEEKFGEKFRIILPEDYDTIRKITDNNDVYGQFDQVISPMDSIKPLEKRIGWTEERIEQYNEERIYSIINSGWDLVIIDEAHRVAGSTGEVARYKLGNLLAAASPYLLLLTATPHNGKTEPFLRLIRLVDEKAFPNMKAVVKEQVAPYVIRTEKREAIDNNGNLLFKNRNTHIVELHWDERHSQQRKLYEMVSSYVSKNYNKALRNRGKNMWVIFLLIMMQRLVTSSTTAVRQSLQKRIKILEEQAFRYESMTEAEFVEIDLEENMEEAIAAISMDIKSEIEDLNQIVAVAQQAEYQYLDVKVEPLLSIVDDIFAEDKNRKLIIFTEFVATQQYLSKLLKDRGYSTSLLNGSLSIEERNLVLAEFREETNILISTDAGGEGLNLQFANYMINYDLPWNPMKIEQRIGRVDRIGQLRDVEIYNFVLADTVETRVKDVLEEKLSVILREIGIDKYADVLDSETAGVNFTDAYLNSIRNPRNIEYNIKPIEEDLRTQVKNTLRIKDLIREDKDLTEFIGADTSFDIEAALRSMIAYYESSIGNPVLSIETYGINDERIIKHLKKEIRQDEHSKLLSISIKDFPNEKGWFMLWHLSVAPDGTGGKTIPVFINENGVLRPLAGKRIWDAILDDQRVISVSEGAAVTSEALDTLTKASQDYAYDVFSDMRAEYDRKIDENHRKYDYALSLRFDAASRIGIENIRNHKLNSLAQEKEQMEAQYRQSKQICPDFYLELLAHME
jgi:superfamily II DNA or RNA helicase